MQMQSWAFILFVAVSVLLYWTAVPRRFRPHFLLAISVGYYFTCSVAFGVFLLIYLYVMFVIGILIDTAKGRRGRMAWLTAGVVGGLGVLFVFKLRAGMLHLAFLLLGQPGAAAAATILAARIGIPLGISYFTFRAIHYLVEVYRGKVIRATWVEFFLYVTFFPAMVSGPIHRFYTIGHEDPRDSFSNQLRGEGGAPNFSLDDFSSGLWRILTGVVKKFVIADFFATLAAPMTTTSGLLPSVNTWQLWAAGHFYYGYLYMDFSGYTDMALGMARLFGFRMMENFHWPISAYNLREFWRRWHMSMTYYAMQYVFIPLGGSRKGRFRTNINLLLTFVAIAAWHNITANMLLWGFIQGVAMVINGYYERFKKRMLPDHQPTWWGKVLGVILMWTWFGACWPIFHHGLRMSVLFYFKMFPFLTYIFPVLRMTPKLGG
jgi:alginate O-acetyltransferase complex protein AlgI